LEKTLNQPENQPTDARWSADVVRRLFTDPQLFAARRLLTRPDAEVQALVQSGRLHITVKADGRSFFATVHLAKLTARGKDFTSSCTCGDAQPCGHVVAGYLLGSANARHARADELLLELIGAATEPTAKEVAPVVQARAEGAALTPETRKWIAEFPHATESDRGVASETLTFALDATEPDALVLDTVGAFVVKDGWRRRIPLAELAASEHFERSLQHACALLLAAGISRPGQPWGEEAAAALLELAAAGRLRVLGDDSALSPAEPDEASVDWERSGDCFRIGIGTSHEIWRVVDSTPPLYVDTDRRIGVLHGLSARAWAWFRRAPLIPVAAADAFQAAIAAEPGIASLLPPVPVFAVEEVEPGHFQPQLLLTGQGSTARAVLSFYYGPVHVTEPGAPTAFRQFIEGRWVVAQRDRDRENACVKRLLDGGMRQEDGITWRFFLEAHFAESTRGGWLRLQSGLFDDLDFEENWRVVIDSDFGFRRSVIEERDSAVATRKLNRRRSR
jgi:hypothetical protein